ncbi:hypothetical protein EON77_12780 [bacterium]|nr:MAG: hypothetical protein EON77_12780 [bacterium]
MADTLRRTTDTLRRGERGVVERVERAVQLLEKASTYLRTRTRRQRIADLQDLVARKPKAAAGMHRPTDVSVS